MHTFRLTVTRRLSVVGFIFLAWCGTASSIFAADIATNSRPATDTKHPAAVVLSPGLAEILRLVKAHIDPSVVKACIDRVPMLYEPSPDELILLKKSGVPDNLLTALLKHGTEQPSSGIHPPAPPPLRPYGPPPFQPGFGFGPLGAAFSPPPTFVTPLILGPTVSFNNSFPTYVDGHPLYTGYYVPGLGYLR